MACLIKRVQNRVRGRLFAGRDGAVRFNGHIITTSYTL